MYVFMSTVWTENEDSKEDIKNRKCK